MTAAVKPPVVLIHGLWLNPTSWEHWVERFEAAGHRVLAPGWPGADASVEELNRDPSALNGVGVDQAADHYQAIVDSLGEQPILMGHSFGGALVQILLSRGRGAAGVAIHPAQVRGVIRMPASTLRATFPAFRNPANRNRAVALTPGQWHYAFCNTLFREDSDALYRRYAVPATARPLFQAAVANFNPRAATAVDFRKPDRAPLLIIGTDRTDHVIPRALTREAKAHYHSGIVELKEFPGRPHFTVGVPGWQEVADYALEWANRLAPARPAPPTAGVSPTTD